MGENARKPLKPLLGIGNVAPFFYLFLFIISATIMLSA